MKAGQLGKCIIAYVTIDDVQVIAVGISLPEPVRAVGVFIQGDNHVMIQKPPGEISDSTSNLKHPPTQFRCDKTALPVEVVLRLGHSLLIFKGVG